MNQRFAIITDQDVRLETVERYLPTAYRATYTNGNIMVYGHDVAGWTLDDYVIPRLASGNIYAKEIS